MIMGLFTIEDKNYIQVNGLEFYNRKSTKVNEIPIDIRNYYINYIETTVKNENTYDIAVYGTSTSAQNNLNHIFIDICK